jgi:hypothetical protein
MIKFLIQKCHKEVTHDFAFTLLEAIRFNNWLQNRDKILYRFIDTEYDDVNKKFTKLSFKPTDIKCVPIGSVEFVTEFLRYFYNRTPKPLNIPQELLSPTFTKRFVFNGTEKEIVDKKFVKSNDKIKAYAEIVDDNTDVPEGNYQISDVINIDSEWRAFVYKDKLRGLVNYGGDFTRFPNVGIINSMINNYKSAPVAYTLDIGICDNTTVVIECHDFFSCGLYGFADLAILPQMFQKWFYNYINDIQWKKREV